MIEYKLEPLIIELTAPKGEYQVTLTITAESDNVCTISEISQGTVAEDKPLMQGKTDIVFKVHADGDILIKIFCDGDITAIAMAQYLGL